MAMIYFYDILVSSEVRSRVDSGCVLDALPVGVACSTFLVNC